MYNLKNTHTYIYTKILIWNFVKKTKTPRAIEFFCHISKNKTGVPTYIKQMQAHHEFTAWIHISDHSDFSNNTI